MIAAAVILYSLAVAITAFIGFCWAARFTKEPKTNIGDDIVYSVGFLILAAGLFALASLAWGAAS